MTSFFGIKIYRSFFDEGRGVGGWKKFFVAMRYPDVFFWRGAFPRIPLSIAYKYFFQKFRPQKIDLAISQTPS